MQLINPQDTAPKPVQSIRVVEPQEAGSLQANRDAKGRFQKGRSGNPGGSRQGRRNRATIIAQQMIDGRGEALINRCIEMAEAGDPTAMRLIMERLVPPRRDRPVKIDLPEIRSSRDALAATSSITKAVALGEITPSEAKQLSELVDTATRALEIHELVERVENLEQELERAKSLSHG